MKNGIDFIYEYSDLNLFHTRVQILTGKYAGIIMEFGGSILTQLGDKNTFNFDYIIYETPDQFYGPKLRTDTEFNKFAGYLIVDVINCRNKDPDEQLNIDEVTSNDGKIGCNIQISEKWYPNGYPKRYIITQPKTNLQGF